MPLNPLTELPYTLIERLAMIFKYPILHWLTEHGWTVTREGHSLRWRDIRPYCTVREYCTRPHIDDPVAFDKAWVVEFDRRRFRDSQRRNIGV